MRKICEFRQDSPTVANVLQFVLQIRILVDDFVDLENAAKLMSNCKIGADTAGNGPTGCHNCDEKEKYDFANVGKFKQGHRIFALAPSRSTRPG